MKFWSGVDLTGNQTVVSNINPYIPFWSGVDLTGNQTLLKTLKLSLSFGAVSIKLVIKRTLEV